MFIGEYNHNLDSKGRISMPVKFRSELGSSAIVTKGLDACLFVYPKEEWQKMTEKLAQLPIANSSARSFSRLMLSGAMELEFDKQGRAVLPAYLRDYAGLKNGVIAAGVLNRVELWDKKAWSLYSDSSESNASENADNLAEWGI
ncbi:MAG: division/cell wall cluster transcriptional repressor MraZ [Patescibacteria group bacterium]